LDWIDSAHADVLLQAGQQLRAIRKHRKLSQKAAAELAGISRMTVSKIERGQSLSFDTLVRLLRAYGLLNRLNDLLAVPEKSPMEKLLDNGA